MLSADADALREKIWELTATPVDSLGEVAGDACGWVKSLAVSLEKVEKKQGGIEIFEGMRGTQLYEQLGKLHKLAAGAMGELGEDVLGAADEMRKKSAGGRKMLKAVGKVAVALNLMLQESEEGYVEQVLGRLGYKRPPPKIGVKNMKHGLELALEALVKFLGMGAVTDKVEAGVVGLMTLAEKVGGKIGKEEVREEYVRRTT